MSSLFASRLPATLTVMLPILLLEVLLAIPFALAVAYVRGSLTDRTVMILSTVAVSISLLVYVIVGQYVFAFRPGAGSRCRAGRTASGPISPPTRPAHFCGRCGGDRALHPLVPHLLPGRDRPRLCAHRARQGLTERTILLKHVLRNAMIPIMTNISVALPGVFVGSFLLEVFFSIPGLGREILLAVNRSDYR